LLYPSNYIALGWGFPAAVGVAVALKQEKQDVPVVSINGDGGFVYSTQELATVVRFVFDGFLLSLLIFVLLYRYNLRMVIVIHNNSTYGAIKNLQKNKHEV